MDEEYDYVVLGTGLVECILSSLLSMQGRKILHLDRNDFYGGECASLSLRQLYQRFRPGISNPPATFGSDRSYNVDLVPKFMMAHEELVSVLIHTEVTRYLEFKQVSGSFVLRKDSVIRVPASPSDVSWRDTMVFGLLELNRIKNFLSFVDSSDTDGSSLKLPFGDGTTALQLYEHFGLGNSAREMVGHALGLHLNDDYLSDPAIGIIKRIQLYKKSALRFGKSPYIYPAYGLSELPQGFARLSAIHGGTFMLKAPYHGVEFDVHGKVCAARCGDRLIKVKFGVIADPSYFPDRVKSVGRVIRAICLLRGPIPNTGNADSLQLIIPKSQVGRKNDIYIACTSSEHKISPPGFYVAIVSTIVEGAFPDLEIQPGIALLGPVLERFQYMSELLEPIDDGCADGIFISKSMDATSHFETMYQDLSSLHKRIVGTPLAVPKKTGSPPEQ